MSQSSGGPRRGRTSLIAALAVIVLLAATVVVAVVWMSQQQTPAPSSTPTMGTSEGAATSAAKPTSGEANAAGCNAPAGDMTEVPADLTWVASQGVTWPTSPTLGPTKTTDGFPVCFSRSPVGAALAAVNSMYAAVDHDPIETFKFYTVDSPGKTASLAKANDIKPLAEQLSTYGMTLKGFQVAEFDEARATIRLVFSLPNSSTGFRTVPCTLVWVDGDWRVKLLDDGSSGDSTDANAGQFIEWSTGV